MASHEEINAALAKVRAHQELTDREKQILKASISKVRAATTEPATAKKRGDGIDRAEVWRKAMKRARELPPVRIEE